MDWVIQLFLLLNWCRWEAAFTWVVRHHLCQKTANWWGAEFTWANRFYVNQFFFKLAGHYIISSLGIFLLEFTTKATRLQHKGFSDAKKLYLSTETIRKCKSLVLSEDRWKVCIIAFSDASHSPDGRQLWYMIGFVSGKVEASNIFHLMAWASHKYRLPVKTTPAAKILATSAALDVPVSFCSPMESIVGLQIKAWELVDSKKNSTSHWLQSATPSITLYAVMSTAFSLFSRQNSTLWDRFVIPVTLSTLELNQKVR